MRRISATRCSATSRCRRRPRSSPTCGSRARSIRRSRSRKRSSPPCSQKGGTLTLADIRTSELESYDTLGGVFSLYTTLSGNAELAKFAWILEWPKLKDDEKRAKYSEFACHELSFFLSRKDPAFFEKVIKPYLANKKDKTFLDDYLLGADLHRYLEPWRYSRLNAAERALLGASSAGGNGERRAPSARAVGAARRRITRRRTACLKPRCADGRWRRRGDGADRVGLKRQQSGRRDAA